MAQPVGQGMATSGGETRRRIEEAAYDLFYRDGFHRVGVDAVADAAGVTKRTLYYHFDSKDALLAAVLEGRTGLAVDRIEHWLGPDSGGPAEMVERLFTALGAWAAGSGWSGSGFTRLTMELAGQPGHPARAAARRHKATIQAMLQDRLAGHGLDDAAGLARRLMILLEGCQAMILISGDRSYASAAAEAAGLFLDDAAAGRTPAAKGS